MHIVRVMNWRKVRWVGCVACMWERRDSCTVEKPEGEKPSGISGRRWNDNFKMDVIRIGERGQG
jgi:hypothetical protein